jgi:hypothetical protein
MVQENEFPTEKSRLYKKVKALFITMTAMWVLSMFFPESLLETSFFMVYALGWVTVTIWCFVQSIIYLVNIKIKRGLAITALVISSFLIFAFMIGVILALVGVSA